MSGWVTALHERVERTFIAWGRLVVRRRWWVTAAMLALTAYLATWLPAMRSDNSAESFLRPGDSARVVYDAFREEFGQDEMIVISIQPDALFTLPTLERIRDLHTDLERTVPYLEEITSLLNARNTRGEGAELIIEDLMEEWPETAAAVEGLRHRVLANPLYVGTLIDEAAELTTITVKPNIYSSLGAPADELAGFEAEGDAWAAGGERPSLLTELESIEQVDALDAVLARHQRPDFHLRMAGRPIMNRHSTKMLMRDVRIFVSGGALLSGILLGFLFRRISGAVLPLLVVIAALLATFGLMVVIGIPASVTGQVVPPLLLAVGICSAVHLMSIVYRRVAEGSPLEEAIPFALGEAGLAVLMASLTTAAGLLAFVSAELAQIANLGIVGAIGVIVTFVYSVTLLPAMVAFLPLRPGDPARGESLRASLNLALARVGDFATSRPRLVLAASMALLALGAPGLAQLKFSQYSLRWFPEDDLRRIDAEFIDRKFLGASTTEIIADTGRENGLYDPDVLDRIERAMHFAQSIRSDGIFVGKATSIVDIVKEIHHALNEGREIFYRIPGDRQVVAQELLLFENGGSDDLEDFTDSLFSRARIVLRMPIVDSMLYPRFLERLQGGFSEILGPDIEITVTGLGSLFGRTYSVLLPVMARSYLIALAIITSLMILLIGSLKRGVVAMLPNLLPIYLTLALMGWLGVVLDNSSLLVGCVIIGLAVDDTIHFMHRFGRNLAKSGDARAAVRETLQTTGSALLFTSLVLAGGFAVISFAYMRNAHEFGILACFAAIVAFLADVVLAPALMVLVTDPAPARVSPSDFAQTTSTSPPECAGRLD